MVTFLEKVDYFPHRLDCLERFGSLRLSMYLHTACHTCCTSLDLPLPLQCSLFCAFQFLADRPIPHTVSLGAASTSVVPRVSSNLAFRSEFWENCVHRRSVTLTSSGTTIVTLPLKVYMPTCSDYSSGDFHPH